MINNLIFIGIGIIVSLSIMIGFELFKKHYFNKLLEDAFKTGANSTKVDKPLMSADDVTNFVVRLCNETFSRRALLNDYAGKPLGNFTDIIREVSAEVLHAISPEFRKVFEFYYSKYYLEEFVVKVIHVLTIDHFKRSVQSNNKNQNVIRF